MEYAECEPLDGLRDVSVAGGAQSLEDDVRRVALYLPDHCVQDVTARMVGHARDSSLIELPMLGKERPVGGAPLEVLIEGEGAETSWGVISDETAPIRFSPLRRSPSKSRQPAPDDGARVQPIRWVNA